MGSPWIRLRSLFSQIKRAFVRTDNVNVPAKFEVLSFTVPEIIGGIQKIGAVPGYAHAPFPPKILRVFVRMDPVNIPAKFEVRSFIRS